MSYEKLLKSLCTIQEKTEAQSGTGAVTNTWATKEANVKFRKRKDNKEGIIGGDFQTTLKDYMFYFLQTTDLDESNRIYISDTEIYQINGVFQDSENHHKEVTATRIIFD